MKTKIPVYVGTTRHPFRATLSGTRALHHVVRNDDNDIKLFVLSFTAFFICFYTLIA